MARDRQGGLLGRRDMLEHREYRHHIPAAFRRAHGRKKTGHYREISSSQGRGAQRLHAIAALQPVTKRHEQFALVGPDIDDPRVGRNEPQGLAHSPALDKTIQCLHARSVSRPWIAVKIASPVAGDANGTSPPARPNAATASRIASRTENASISGGSPTALLPWMVFGCVALGSKVTLNSMGASLNAGI